MEYLKLFFLLKDIKSVSKVAILIVFILLIISMKLFFTYQMRKEPKKIKEIYKIDADGSRIIEIEKEFR